jgi:hypothetical protein
LLGFKEKINRNWKRWVKSLIIWELGATKWDLCFLLVQPLKHLIKKTRKAALCPNLGKLIIYTC